MRRRMRHGRGAGPAGAFAARGFTLVEVLVTIAFAAILLPTVMSGLSMSLSAGDFARREAQAAALAHSKLSEIIATYQYQNGGTSGDFGTDWPDYRWQSAVSEWDGATLLQVDVTVSWIRSGHDHSVMVTTLVYQPGVVQ
jgi:type II secretion system protein I